MDLTPYTRLHRYRAWFASVLLPLLALSGCASVALRHSTVTVSTSVGVILEEQVLENLSRFYDMPYAMPSQVVLSSGAVQVQNQLTSTLKLPYTNTLSSSKEADLGGTLQWQETWTITPVTDSEDIYRLQYLYQGAVVNLLPDNKKPRLHTAFLAFDAGLLHFGSSYQKKDCKPVDSKDETGHTSQFEDCEAIVTLLSNSPEWLAIDVAPTPTSQQEAEHPADPFVERPVYRGHRIWIRPKEFSEFMLYILYATPKSKADTKPLGLSVNP